MNEPLDTAYRDRKASQERADARAEQIGNVGVFESQVQAPTGRPQVASDCKHGIDAKSCGVCYTAAETVGTLTGEPVDEAWFVKPSKELLHGNWDGLPSDQFYEALSRLPDAGERAQRASAYERDRQHAIVHLDDLLANSDQHVEDTRNESFVQRLERQAVERFPGIVAGVEDAVFGDDEPNSSVLDEITRNAQAAFNFVIPPALPSADVQAVRLIARQKRIDADQAQLDVDQVVFNETQQPLDRHDQHIDDILEQPHGAGCEQ